MRSRLLAILSALAALVGILTVAPSAASALDGPPPVVSEVMFNSSASPEAPWEWIELYNPGTDAIDLTGWVVDDINGTAVTAPNIAAGSIPAGGSAVLYNGDSLTAADFEAAWGTGINLVAVANWSALALNNTGDTIGLWEDAASYSGDQAVHANALVSVAYDGTIDDGTGSVHLSDLTDQSSWTLSTDGLATPVGTSYTAAAAGGNPGTDVGSPSTTVVEPPSSDLFFSQYVEGSGFNKAIEIANLDANAKSLDGYTLELYSNGASAPNTTSDLTGFGTVGPSDVFVITSTSTIPPLSDLGDATAAAVNWNGDDAIVLRNPNGDVVDSIGQVGFDPGSAWTANGVSTQNDTMCRNSDVTSGDTDPSDVFDPSAEWTSLGFDVFDGIGQIGCDPAPSADELFFSQYVEGSSFNKAIEIANIGTGPKSLDGYVLELYSNGSAAVSSSTDLTGFGSVGASDVFVLYNSNSSNDIIAVGDASAGVVNWNGDDAVVLRNPDGDIVDSIGQVGFDPGSAWTANGVSTANDTICRNSDITSGDTDPSDIFDPSAEWFSLGNDVITGLGEIGCDSGPPTGQMVKIHEIQGSGPASPLLGQAVESQGIVTSLFEDNDALDAFFLQEEDSDADADPATSEGIFVFCRNGAGCPTGLAVGDLVTVTGQVEEFFGMTQIDAETGSIVIDSSGNPLPTAVSVDLPAAAPTNAEATFENLEGMLVTFTDKLVVSEYFQLARFGQLVLTADARPDQFTDVSAPDVAGFAAFQADLASKRIILDDNNNDNNDATTAPLDNELYPHPDGGFSTTNLFRGGDSITNLTGVMHWSFAGASNTNAWRIRKTVGPDYSFTQENPRTAAPAPVGGSLKVASFNVLNYFTTIDEGSATCGPSNLGCRGAHSAAELARQRDKIVSAISAIDADVVGLIEIENDTASVADLVAGLNASLGAGTYAELATGPIGGDAIKVAFIYKPGTVAAVGDFAVLDSSVDPTFIDTKNRPVLIQTFEETATGERVTIAVNHLKSKGSSCDDVGDPDLNDGQANCSGTRTAAATALANFLATDPTGSGDSDSLIIGDLNAYAMEDPITALTTAGYTDLVAQFGGPDAYSFVFDGQLGYLDHALANDSLQPQVTGVSVWHINADEVNLLDYNDDIQDGNEASFERESSQGDLYDPDAYRSSDHDPVVIGLNLAPGVPTCNGLPATIIGTDDSETLNGTGGDDVIVGLGSADVINGRGGNDVICGGEGKDTINGDTGDDVIFGEDGRDKISGGSGDDYIDGGADDDTIDGRAGNDTIFGRDGKDNIKGDNGDDIIDGGAGKDKIAGQADDDTINGGADNDSIKGDNGDDVIFGDGGNDNIQGGSGDDSLDGGDGNDTLKGNSGTDTCTTGETLRSCEF